MGINWSNNITSYYKGILIPQDVNDERPIFDRWLYEVTVSEAAAPGLLLLTANASDADSGLNGQIRYHLEPLLEADKKPRYSVSSFNVDSQSGELRLAEELDFETQRTVRFWLVATDRGTPPLSERVPVHVTVTDASDNVPEFVRFPPDADNKNDGQPCLRSVTISDAAPTDAFVIRVPASDRDVNDSLRYSVLNTKDYAFFRIGPDGGAGGTVFWQ
ncbi:unnamed protein product, partial [Dibothriocephalus latus]